MIRRVYTQYFKNNLFMKTILLFSIFTIIAIIAFSYLMYDFMSQSIVNSELDKQKKAMESVDHYLTNKYEAVQSMVTDVYKDEILANNVSYFLQHSFQEYVSNNLDQFDLSKAKSSLNGLEYFRNKMEDDRSIEDMILYSANQQFMYVNTPDRTTLISTNASRSYVPDAIAMEINSVASPSFWMRKAMGQLDPRLYSIRSPINDKATLKNIGQLFVYYKSSGIQDALVSYNKDLKGSILVLADDGDVLFDSSDRYYGAVYPYMKMTNSLYKEVTLDKPSYMTTLTQNKAGYMVVGVAAKSEIAMAYRSLRNTIIFISALCIFFAILLPSLFVINFAKRTKKIIRFMGKVEKGDLNARIYDLQEDELGQISRSFNEMLDELTRYIDRVYKAEIKQKHTELSALQARVNPHFLYNTLEVIRMRAISQGAGDVGEMIYSLSVLFKHSYEQKSVYTLEDEIEVCRLYLELFRIRYKDKLSYVIEWDKGLAKRQIMKLSLQPIIENYIVHGLQAQREDNRIVIRIQQVDDLLRFEFADNGIGIAQDKLLEIQQSLIELDSPEEAFGLRSVNDRLRLFYGIGHGIKIDSELGKGTTVTVWFPFKEGGDDHHV
ncbi:sensor histidine kinase [Paenibacillus psychroresistens]|uniref:histidine kinase n=1 Tax=Paenibacillus psychroresistens TaxID=1778678 RepID=A0A6B8RWJ2_9BACL|nr:histidine kinase [Paenibacillus psychroresistens]QGQ99743.1 sensor histidine kinase [Paenibacillus psychroresistens]